MPTTGLASLTQLRGDGPPAYVVCEAGSHDVRLVERGASAWNPPVTLGTDPAVGSYCAAARSMDGSRVAAVSTGPVPAALWTRDATGISRWTWASGDRLSLGFRADGKAWILAYPSNSVRVARRPAVLFEEP